MWKRKLWWGQKQRYTPLQWIQGDGRTQYVDFDGYYPDENWAIEIVATPKEFGTQGYCHAYGAGSASSAADAVICVLNGTGGTLCRFVGTVHSGIAIQLDTQYTIYQDANICTANGDKTPTNSGTASGTALSYPLRLFRNPTATEGNLPKLCGVIQFSSVRAWNKTTGKLILDVVPVLDKDGVPCFWDRVGNKLYYNKGTGSFTYKEWDYTEVDYLKSSGTQYFDMYLWSSGYTRTRLKYTSLKQTGENTQALFGSYEYVSNLSDRSFNLYISDSTNILSGRLTTQANNTFEQIDYDTTHIIDADCKNATIEIDGVVTNVSNVTHKPATLVDMYLLWRHHQLSEPMDKAIGKLWWCQAFDNGVLVRDCRAAVDVTNKPCLYDACLNILWYNKGTGDFEAYVVDGNNDYRVVKFITTSGQQSNQQSTTSAAYIDTGIGGSTTKGTKIRTRMYFTNTVSGTSNEALVGTNRSGRFVFGFANLTPKTDFYVGLGSQNVATGITRDTNVHIFELDAGNNTWKIDANSGTFTTGSFANSGSFWLFARNSGSYANANKPVNGGCSWHKVWENGAMVQNLIAVYDGTTAFMWDTVTKTKFENIGDGTKVFGYTT